ncbi:MAG: hypothetical protein ACFE0J_18025 [Elainellaceae cyanobacterium]
MTSYLVKREANLAIAAAVPRRLIQNLFLTEYYRFHKSQRVD